MKKILFLILLQNIVYTLTADISDNVFGGKRQYIPAAFGDFNSDGLTDVFVLDGNNQLSVLLAYDKEPLLRSSPHLTCTFDQFIIKSVVPGDFDGDAFMDIMITTQNVLPEINFNGTSVRDVIQQVRVIWGGVDVLNCSIESLPELATLRGQPLALDYNGDMIIDLFGVNENGQRSFWIFGNNRTEPVSVLMNERSDSHVKVPHSHSFLDINGDYISDLLITTPTVFEVWFGRSVPPSFEYAHNIELPIGILSGHIGQALFLDVELSGKLYLLLPLCYDKECINSTILINDDGIWHPLFLNFQDDNVNTWGFIPPSEDLFVDTITMRAGDYNMDGYPDLLVTLRSEVNSDYQSFLMENVPCDSKACSFIRTYKIIWNALYPFKKGTVLSVFYDFYQDGILDFIILQRNKTTGEYAIGALKNTLEYDANFIKVMVLTGLTNAYTPVTSPFDNTKLTYGTNLPGPRISYHTLSQEGLPRSGVCTQLPQSAHFVLNLPYSVFGLDRTPNFVDTLMVGLSNRSKTWTQLIPNSQIVVIPWPPNDPSQWKVQLFVTPSKVIMKSAYVYCGICGLLTLLVIFMHYKEKSDDKLEALNSEVMS